MGRLETAGQEGQITDVLELMRRSGYMDGDFIGGQELMDLKLACVSVKSEIPMVQCV